MKLVGFAICPFTQRARAVLSLKGLPHEVELSPLSEPTPALLAASPSGEGPALLVEGGSIIGSHPILEYLEETSPHVPLFPDQPLARARTRAWIDVADRTYLTQCSFLRAEGVVRMERRQETLLSLLGRLGGELSELGTAFHGGDVPSVADAAWFPVFLRVHLLLAHTEHDLLAALPDLARYSERLLAVEALRQAVPDDFEERFVDFYLSNLTHLGRMMLVRRGRSGEAQPETSEEEPLHRCR